MEAPASAGSSTALTRTLLAPNAGPMTLDGTNTYLISGSTGRTVVVDPGPLDEDHLQAITAAGEVELILITHRHLDHTEAAVRLHELTAAPVRAADPVHCHGGAPLRDGERIEAADAEIVVLATPGHTDDSVSFHLPHDGPTGAVLTGDTILGRGTTVIAHPDGNLTAYFATLDVLESVGAARVLPAHGPQLPDLTEICRQYREHRMMRLDQVRAALSDAGLPPRSDPETVDALVSRVYPDATGIIRMAAEKSLAAQLEYLAAV